jgi:DMSO/TMAO reductase YedYZ molybdopterin-dependent catalytic subunit
MSHIMDNNIIIADHLNGLQLPPEQGFPFQLVAEQKWGYKWARWITKVELSADEDYQGFWESRGYSDDGDLDKPKFGN